MGRPTKMTEELIEDFCRGISNGLSAKAACDFCCISEASLYAYLAQGEEDFDNGVESIYSEFFKRLKKARSSFKLYHMNKIREASENGNWQASAWALERCYPNEYGRKLEQVVEYKASDEAIKEVEDALLEYGEEAEDN